jgi:hypothetical protein
MYFAIMEWKSATLRIAVDIVGEHYTDECFTKSLLYWLDPKAQRWQKEFYNGFYGFRKAYFTKVRRICNDMLRSPYCAGKKVISLKVFNPATGMLETPEGIQGSDIEVDPTTLPKPIMFKSFIEEIHDSLDNSRDKQIFKMMFHGFNNTEIAERLGLSSKTVRNRKSLLLNTIREKYRNGDYTFKIEKYTALDRQIGKAYYNPFFSNFTEVDVLG